MEYLNILWIVGSVVIEGGLMWGLFWLGSRGQTGGGGTRTTVLATLPVMFILAPGVVYFIALKMDRSFDFVHMVAVESFAAGLLLFMFGVTSFRRSAVFVALFCVNHAVASLALTAHFGRTYTPLQEQVRHVVEVVAVRTHWKHAEREDFGGPGTISRRDWDAGGGRGKSLSK